MTGHSPILRLAETHSGRGARFPVFCQEFQVLWGGTSGTGIITLCNQRVHQQETRTCHENNFSSFLPILPEILAKTNLETFPDQFLRAFFKGNSFFFLWGDPSKPLAAPQPLNIAFPLGKGGVLRSQKGEGLRKEGDGGGGKKKEKGTRKKCSVSVGSHAVTFTDILSPPKHLRSVMFVCTMVG